MISTDTQKLIKKLLPKWEKAQALFKSGPNSWDDITSPIGTLYWLNPNILFIFITGNEESYEGSQTQIGLTKDGRIVWEYQSHCSCNGYEASHEHGTELDLTKKTYELEKVPMDWEAQVRENITKILNALK